jgi:hypothetical protein
VIKKVKQTDKDKCNTTIGSGIKERVKGQLKLWHPRARRKEEIDPEKNHKGVPRMTLQEEEKKSARLLALLGSCLPV